MRSMPKKVINSQLLTISWDRIGCPLDGHHLSADIVRKFLDPAALTKYNNFVELRPIRNDPNFRWCANPKCQSGQIHKGGEVQPKMVCKECLSLTCFTHERAWHWGQTCKEFDEHLNPEFVKQAASSEKEIRTSSAPCPKCSRPVTKLGGCATFHCEYIFDNI
ncbi:hypothetical protein N431DRAFT_394595 [Stipitochalara longipes BDJ]|nr:hypothetical protein N431DRAFT_394595 [Stipitochalara longipes BDJ]